LAASLLFAVTVLLFSDGLIFGPMLLLAVVIRPGAKLADRRTWRWLGTLLLPWAPLALLIGSIILPVARERSQQQRVGFTQLAARSIAQFGTALGTMAGIDATTRNSWHSSDTATAKTVSADTLTDPKAAGRVPARLWVELALAGYSSRWWRCAAAPLSGHSSC